MDDRVDLAIEDNDGSNIEPFVFFQLALDDNGSTYGRTRRPEFISRTPWCVRWAHDLSSVKIIVSNAGYTASDLVVVDYQIIFCVFKDHGPQDGFTVTHAGETADNQFEKVISAAVVPALGTTEMEIDLSEYSVSNLVNIYLRARVSTLFSEDLPYDQWDFASDITVTEAHIRVPREE